MSDSRSQTTQTTYLHSPSAQQASPAAEPEILLDRYRVLARRGNGGFGTVCTCWDTRLQRRVAIKRMPLLGASETPGVLASTVDEALSEARTACLLAHPNIVTVHDFEIEGDYAYLVMEFVDGLNLSELLARVEGGYLTYAEAAHMVSSLAKALQYAHENGVLHLDIKPTNIMIDRQGTVKLADFGMATLASAAGYGGARGGTVGYMPPEQVEGMLVDERADIFSLAVVLRQALTGTNIFAGRTAKESLDRMYKGPKIPLLKEDPEVPFAVDAALTQALSPEPSMRQGSVLEFAQDIVAPLGSE
ncbi:MAG: serine/threonine protein kinase, partial [Atopobium sp.]|nr:serine/threonine protein kinase [Atopobium sp.]